MNFAPLNGKLRMDPKDFGSRLAKRSLRAKRSANSMGWSHLRFMFVGTRNDAIDFLKMDLTRGFCRHLKVTHTEADEALSTR